MRQEMGQMLFPVTIGHNDFQMFFRVFIFGHGLPDSLEVRAWIITASKDLCAAVMKTASQLPQKSLRQLSRENDRRRNDVPRHILADLAVYDLFVLKLEKYCCGCFQFGAGDDQPPIFGDHGAFLDRPRREQSQPVGAAFHRDILVQQSFHGIRKPNQREVPV
jgi:hypothetical protein